MGAGKGIPLWATNFPLADAHASETFPRKPMLYTWKALSRDAIIILKVDGECGPVTV